MKVTARAIACGHELLHEFWFQFPSPKAPIAFWIPGYDATYSAEQWYESSWSSIQLNLDEGTVLAFICRCSSELPIVPSLTFSEWNDSQVECSSPGHQAGLTEATGPLSPKEEDPIACDVGYFVFCGLVGSKDRPKVARRIGIAPTLKGCKLCCCLGSICPLATCCLQIGIFCQVLQVQC